MSNATPFGYLFFARSLDWERTSVTYYSLNMLLSHALIHVGMHVCMCALFRSQCALNIHASYIETSHTLFEWKKVRFLKVGSATMFFEYSTMSASFKLVSCYNSNEFISIINKLQNENWYLFIWVSNLSYSRTIFIKSNALLNFIKSLGYLFGGKLCIQSTMRRCLYCRHAIHMCCSLYDIRL